MQQLIFFGSDHYSAVVLSSLLQSDLRANGLTDLHVITDQRHEQTPVEKLAKMHNLKVCYYPTFDHTLITKDTLGLCASFDHLIPMDIIKLFGGNLYNLHPSLLPQYRNVSPVQYAIALGDTETGITLFRISPGIDDGEIIAQAEEPIKGDDTTPTLTPRLFKLGAQLFIDATKNGFTGQPIHGSTKNLIFTRRLKRDSGYIEWGVLHRLLKNEPVAMGESANELLNLRLDKEKSNSPPLSSSIYLLDLMRALTPWPTVWSLVPSKKKELRVTLESVIPDIKLKIAGKPKSISWSDFRQYYL